MKKLISITLLSAAAMLAAPKAQNASPATSTPVKKAHKKHTAKKAKAAAKPATTPAK